MRLFAPFLVMALSLSTPMACAEGARVAVASNFAPIAEKLAASYAGVSGGEVTIIGGATGKLFAQITAGAPFDAFLSADQKTVAKLAENGLALPDSRFTYARGQLALWTARTEVALSDPTAALLAASHIAIANPDLAPYGKAAAETIEKLGLFDALSNHLVIGENIGQAQTLVASKAADLGFVAASGLADKGGSFWIVPEDMHAPLLQDAILLTRGKDNKTAIGFLHWLRGDEARAIISAAGYSVK
ncbi:MAG: molybdate ABC transporter substrate-binding protein [Rhodobacteraceae bacterium]|nr:molybdate ABC transporter substrate-binding protein [Paracoccaceae bacterium]